MIVYACLLKTHVVKMVSLFLGSILLVPVWLLSLFDGLLSVVTTVNECSGISE